MKLNGKLLPILFGISLTTFGLSIAVLLYPLLIKDNNEKNDNEKKKYWSKKSEKVATKKPTRLEIIVPKQSVSAIIGRNGSVIKDIQARTNTYVNIEKNKNLESQHVNIIIQGDEVEYIMLAKCLIDEKVENHKKIKTCKVMFLSNDQHAQISHEAECIQEASGAKLSFLSNSCKGDKKEHKLLIKGTTEEIEKAISEIEKTYLKKEEGDKTIYDDPDTLMSNSSSLEVYVSAIESPDQFWIQVVGPKLNEFEKLENEMTKYYNNKDIREFHLLSKIEVNKVVAAKYEDKWYRAEIIDVNLPLCTVYLLDYGKIVKNFSTDNILELRTDMLSLRVQAIECKLGYICPLEKLEWSSDATQAFSTLVQPGEKKVLIAKRLDYIKRPNTSYRKNEWVLELALYTENFTNIAQVLIGLQLAKTVLLPSDVFQKSLIEDCKKQENE